MKARHFHHQPRSGVAATGPIAFADEDDDQIETSGAERQPAHGCSQGLGGASEAPGDMINDGWPCLVPSRGSVSWPIIRLAPIRPAEAISPASLGEHLALGAPAEFASVRRLPGRRWMSWM